MAIIGEEARPQSSDSWQVKPSEKACSDHRGYHRHEFDFATAPDVQILLPLGVGRSFWH